MAVTWCLNGYIKVSGISQLCTYSFNMGPSRTARSFSVPPPSLLSLTIASIQRPHRSRSSNTPACYQRDAIVQYEPEARVDDQLAAFDPDTVACQFYIDQVKLFSDLKLLATFDVEKEEYVHWDV